MPLKPENMLSMIFFLLHFSRVGVRAGLGNPSPLGADMGVKFLSPPGLGSRAGLGTVKQARGQVC